VSLRGRSLEATPQDPTRPSVPHVQSQGDEESRVATGETKPRLTPKGRPGQPAAVDQYWGVAWTAGAAKVAGTATGTSTHCWVATWRGTTRATQRVNVTGTCSATHT